MRRRVRGLLPTLRSMFGVSFEDLWVLPAWEREDLFAAALRVVEEVGDG